ncbi:single-stranded DNA-binding protein [Actinoplanes sp. ATCC 53533]|uniref:single-stranded DNA-binding protein n=1 Tax=Actinoplanes sp. ATCC 53533 TaxID=1288362 RepID=UPI000F78CC31|nr:single-stranded DNA-binding protein [Actinoplanes sp. ATCC 53533]RSM39549.1 single-stranded DNA-binding protein [Actinoplanes sp. ATCC 53533]
MFDTNIVVVGNVLTAPEWRRTASTNTLVANFRVASTARRLDRDTGRWVDGNHLRVRVNCWRRLAEGVAASVMVGDPVVVAGRLYTRDWTDSEGNLRTTYEMEAMSVGHDLARGKGRFFRNKPAAATSATETVEAEGQVRGEAAMPVAEDEAPAVYGDGVLDGDEPTFEDVPATTPGGFDPMAALRGGSIEPFDTTMVIPAGDAGPIPDPAEPEPDPVPAPDQGPGGAPGSGADPGPVPGPGPGPRSGPESRSNRTTERRSAGTGPGADRPDPEGEAGSESPARRTGRSRSPRRQPVPA